MIAAEMQNALNEQINEEYCLWYFYRSAAAYCHETNLTGFSKWLHRHSEKKLGQASRLSDFVVDRRGHFEAKPISLANGHWTSPLAVLDSAMQRERHLSESVAKLSRLRWNSRSNTTSRCRTTRPRTSARSATWHADCCGY